jgi:succinate dehydrogenase / fumarate reductase cytochrome b subunit
MGITGVLLVLFVIGHMLGNLQVFVGREQLNAYAAKLQGLGGLLWVIRLGLFGIFAAHVLTGVVLTLKNWKARPIAYANQQPLQSTLFSRTMIWSGLALFAFVVYHLLHFTILPQDPALLLEDGHVDVYGMVIAGFKDPAVTISYVIAMLLLGFHLVHGIASMFQSMGWNAPKYETLTHRLGVGLASILVLGNVAMPLSVLFGLIGGNQG